MLADLQTNRVTGYERGAVDRLMALRADVILLPGDLFQGLAGCQCPRRSRHIRGYSRTRRISERRRQLSAAARAQTVP